MANTPIANPITQTLEYSPIQSFNDSRIKTFKHCSIVPWIKTNKSPR